MVHGQYNVRINILLADDDADERYFFDEAVNELPIATNLMMVNDGILLKDYLNGHLECLPDILFLDINMPRKNGRECLIEIKGSLILKHLPVIIYSNAGSIEDTNSYYQCGAIGFLGKGNYPGLIQHINKALSLGTETKALSIQGIWKTTYAEYLQHHHHQ